MIENPILSALAGVGGVLDAPRRLAWKATTGNEYGEEITGDPYSGAALEAATDPSLLLAILGGGAAALAARAARKSIAKRAPLGGRSALLERLLGRSASERVPRPAFAGLGSGADDVFRPAPLRMSSAGDGGMGDAAWLLEEEENRKAREIVNHVERIWRTKRGDRTWQKLFGSFPKYPDPTSLPYTDIAKVLDELQAVEGAMPSSLRLLLDPAAGLGARRPNGSFSPQFYETWLETIEREKKGKMAEALARRETPVVKALLDESPGEVARRRILEKWGLLSAMAGMGLGAASSDYA
jgi:hypothetical protein